MPRLYRLITLSVFTLLCLSLIITSNPTLAQDNLLLDPGFESQATWKRVATGTGDGDGGTTFNVAPDWNGWFTEQPRTDSWMNRMPNGFPRSDAGFGFVRSGNRSQELARGSATFTAAVWQTVAVPEGSNVTGSAYHVMNISGDNAANANSQARVGIDPNGGNNPYDSDVIWSAWATNSLASNGFRQLTVNATATGPAVTIFLFATQTVPTEGNGIYWDDAVLSVGGPGGVAEGVASGTPPPTAVPTAPPSVPFVQPQGARDDGSIVHVVQAGDTIDSIAVAYGSTRDEIVELNDLPSVRFLRIGQEILIRPPQEPTETPTQRPTRTPTRTPTEDEPDEPAETEDDDADSAADDEDESDADAEDSGAVTEDDDDTDSADSAEDEKEEETRSQQGQDDESDEDDSDGEAVAQVTEEAPEPTDVPPTPTTMPTEVAQVEEEASPELGVVCVSMFEDLNMNRIQDQNELYLGGGMVELNEGETTVDTVATTNVPDPLCFSELEGGEYVALAIAPSGYGLTTPEQLRLRVQPGSTLNIAFGAAEGVAAVEPPPADVADEVQQDVALETETTVEDDDLIERLLPFAGLAVLGLAGLTLVGGIGAMLLLRRG